uniref:Uncharacterized protein n=1 Tax=Oryctolagus cuniculus TaxID=9986 RepID=A0A5F9CWC7_RABIT
MDTTAKIPNPVKTLQEEAVCAICLDYFTDPVSIRCGHNFCRVCITQLWESNWDSVCFTCPQCRKSFHRWSFRPNLQLANMVQVIRQMHPNPAQGSHVNEQAMCPKHQEALTLFCKVDEEAICVVCRESRRHKQHSVVPVEEVVQGYKAKLQGHLEPLRKHLGELQDMKAEEERRLAELNSQMDLEVCMGIPDNEISCLVFPVYFSLSLGMSLSRGWEQIVILFLNFLFPQLLFLMSALKLEGLGNTASPFQLHFRVQILTKGCEILFEEAGCTKGQTCVKKFPLSSES